MEVILMGSAAPLYGTATSITAVAPTVATQWAKFGMFPFLRDGHSGISTTHANAVA
jgi:hypothetical protein